jgi:hypothetical protein
LSHCTSPFCVRYFQGRVSWTICLGWLWTVILLLSASWVARITGVSHWCPVRICISNKLPSAGHPWAHCSVALAMHQALWWTSGFLIYSSHEQHYRNNLIYPCAHACDFVLSETPGTELWGMLRAYL